MKSTEAVTEEVRAEDEVDSGHFVPAAAVLTAEVR